MSLGSDIDRLYQLPPGEFTPAHNALASQVKKSGDAAGAARIKALAKPSVSARARGRAGTPAADLRRRPIDAPLIAR